MGKYKTHIEVKDRKIRIDYMWRTLEDISTETLIETRNKEYKWIEILSELSLPEKTKQRIIDERKQLIKGLDTEIELRKMESQGESNL